MISNFLNKLGPFKWTIHNVLAHPIAEIFWLFKLRSIGNFIHDITVPSDSLNEETIDPGTTTNSFD